MQIVKNISITIVAAVILVSAVTNIKNQLETLFEAKQRTSELERKIIDLSQKNAVLERKIEYATSSAFKEQQVRNMLGMGTDKDYWLILPPEEKLAEKLETKAVEVKKANWQQWWDLFTR